MRWRGVALHRGRTPGRGSRSAGAVTADPSSGTIPTGYLILHVTPPHQTPRRRVRVGGAGT